MCLFQINIVANCIEYVLSNQPDLNKLEVLHLKSNYSNQRRNKTFSK